MRRTWHADANTKTAMKRDTKRSQSVGATTGPTKVPTIVKSSKAGMMSLSLSRFSKSRGAMVSLVFGLLEALLDRGG